MLSYFRLIAAAEETSKVVSEAVESSADAPAGAGALSKFMPLIMLAVFAAIFYFLLIRPEKKRKKAEQKLRDSMQVGDTVITIGGITGEIESIREETITLFTGSNSVDVQKWAVRTVVPDSASTAGESADGAEGADGADGAEGTDGAKDETKAD